MTSPVESELVTWPNSTCHIVVTFHILNFCILLYLRYAYNF